MQSGGTGRAPQWRGCIGALHGKKHSCDAATCSLHPPFLRRPKSGLLRCIGATRRAARAAVRFTVPQRSETSATHCDPLLKTSLVLVHCPSMKVTDKTQVFSSAVALPTHSAGSKARHKASLYGGASRRGLMATASAWIRMETVGPVQ